MCYRLPLQNTIALRYQQEVPLMHWNFFNESEVIIGYECSKETTEFAGRKYTAWFTTEIPMPYGPYKFNGLPGLILKIEDNEKQFIWEAIGFERTEVPILQYKYEGEKKCSEEEARN